MALAVSAAMTARSSALAAREAVATGIRGAESIRSGGVPLEVPPVPEELRAYFDGGQA